jgi:hypothetical protein
MKAYHIYFLILKAVIVIQFTLLITNKEIIELKGYMITEIIFKTSLSIFLLIFLYFNPLKDVAFEDKIIISFAGGLLLYDAWFNDFPQLLKEYGIKNVMTNIHTKV